MKNSKETIWIAITGMDGAGKTSLKDKLAEILVEQGKSVKNIKYPYNRDDVLRWLDKSGDGKPYLNNRLDHLIFLADNRLAAQDIEKWKANKEYDYIISQRCELDSFTHGLVRGFNYEVTTEWVEDLIKPDILIHLNVDSGVGYKRINNGGYMDKFEIPEYLAVQEWATEKVFLDLLKESAICELYKDTKQFYLDTTKLTMVEVLEKVITYLKNVNAI